ncbi:MAG: BPSS1780 family membrane protein [Betaproteobacteria bacterium]
MKAAVVSFARGMHWLGEGWRLYRSAPLTWLMLVFLYWILMTAVSSVPAVGVAIAVTLIPVFSVGFMAASRSCAAGRLPGIADLFAGFRGNLPAQLALGAVYFALLAAVLWATTLADGGALARWMGTGVRPDEQTLRSDEFLAALALAAACYAPVMMLYWFAPVLSAWHGTSVPKSLFFSLAACLMNWRALTGYGVAAALVTILIPFLVLSALLIASGGRLQAGVMGIMLPLLLALMPMLYASFFASYRDIFDGADAAREAAAPPG